MKAKLDDTIGRITELNYDLKIQNRLRDKISVEDVDQYEQLLDDSDSDDENVHTIGERAAGETADENLHVDQSFSLQYGYTLDVSGARFVNFICNLKINSFWNFTESTQPRLRSRRSNIASPDCRYIAAMEWKQKVVCRI